MNDKEFAAFGSPSDVISEENFKQIFDIEARVVSYGTDQRENMRCIVPVAASSFVLEGVK
jgi:ABC-type cobalamin/Fe3+-siderophores transport system ATPase subunit